MLPTAASRIYVAMLCEPRLNYFRQSPSYDQYKKGFIKVVEACTSI